MAGDSGSDGKGKKKKIKEWRQTQAARRQNPNQTSVPF
jgi:hypothetical protein